MKIKRPLSPFLRSLTFTQADETHIRAISDLDARVEVLPPLDHEVVQELLQRRASILVALRGTEVIGFTVAMNGRLFRIVVAPKHQKKGLGRQLLARAKIKEVYVRQRQHAISKFLNRCRWVCVGTHADYYKGDPRDDALIFHKLIVRK